jgi:hypothetical protein
MKRTFQPIAHQHGAIQLTNSFSAGPLVKEQQEQEHDHEVIAGIMLDLTPERE